MLFLTYKFLWVFFPICFAAYWIVPKSVRIYVLLIANFVFYALSGPSNLLLLVIYIVFSFVTAHIISRVPIKFKRPCLITGIVSSFLLLFIFKYLGWSIRILNSFIALFGLSALPEPLLSLPLGLSFYLFTGTGYLIDVYRDKQTPISNIIEYSAFISFFPTIVSGPIQRADGWMREYKQKKRLSISRVKQSFLLFLWGAFLKMVLSDRIAGFTNTIYGNYMEYHGWIMLLAVFGYSIQIYTDFAGYSSMALGLACALGFDLPENFKQPYFSLSIAEFWRRWHISLSSWFRDYLYIPLGGNRKGKFRKNINVLIVFLVSGLWHGTGMTFIVWGGLHGIFQVIGSFTLSYRERLCEKLHIDRESFSFGLWQRAFVFLSVSFAWIFFRADSLTQALDVLHRSLQLDNPWIFFDNSLESLGLGFREIIILIFSLSALLIVSLLKNKGVNFQMLEKQGWLFQSLVYGGLIVVILVYGIYGPGFSAEAFIYAGF